MQPFVPLDELPPWEPEAKGRGAIFDDRTVVTWRLGPLGAAPGHADACRLLNRSTETMAVVVLSIGIEGDVEYTIYHDWCTAEEANRLLVESDSRLRPPLPGGPEFIIG